MSKSGIPDSVREFIVDKIDSIGQLEVLLLLYRTSEQKWTAKAVGEELRSSEEGSARHFEILHSRQLILKEDRPGECPCFYYVSHPIHDPIIAKLRSYYETYKVTVISLIYEKPRNVLQSFANAFKLKKDS